MYRSAWASTLLLLLTLLMGCESVRYGGAPAPSFDIDKDLKELAKKYGEDISIEKFYQNPTKEARNEFITGRLVMMNIRYIQFVRKSTSDKQLLDSATDILVLSLNIAGAAVSAAGTKTVLAAIAAGVTGSKVVIDKNFYYEKTVPALVGAMNASRKQKLAAILEGMTKDLDEYNFAQAVTDLHEYYFAGTFLGAIQAIQTDSGAKEQVQDAKIDVIRAKLSRVEPEIVITKGSLTDAIGKLKPEDLDKIKAALKLLDGDAYQEPANFEDARTRLQAHVREARTPERISEVAAALKKVWEAP